MKELCSKFLSLLRYVSYIIDEKPKILCFLSFLSLMFKDRIEYDHLKTLEEAIRKRTSVIFRIRIKEKIYLTRKLKDMTTLIKERGILSVTKILGITTKGIKKIIIKI